MLVNIYEAKTNLSKFVDRAAAGEEVIIARSGRPVARLVAYDAPVQNRTPGRMRGEIWVAEDFDSTPGWLLDAFDGVGSSEEVR